MGYDIVRMDENGKQVKITDLNDENYFRWNIFGMGRTRDLAAWGIGAMTNEEIGRSVGKSADTKMGSFDNVKEAMGDMLAQIREAFRTPKYSEDVPWGNAFVHNGDEVSGEACSQFADALQAAIDKIFSSPVRPDIDLDYTVQFIEYLRNSPNGVYVG